MWVLKRKKLSPAGIEPGTQQVASPAPYQLDHTLTQAQKLWLVVWNHQVGMGEHGVFLVVWSQMEELGHQNLASDSLSSALSNGENRISSFLLVASIHGSVRFGACMHKRWEKWLEIARPFRWCGVKWRSYGLKIELVPTFLMLYRMVKTASLHSF